MLTQSSLDPMRLPCMQGYATSLLSGAALYFGPLRLTPPCAYLACCRMLVSNLNDIFTRVRMLSLIVANVANAGSVPSSDVDNVCNMIVDGQRSFPASVTAFGNTEDYTFDVSCLPEVSAPCACSLNVAILKTMGLSNSMYAPDVWLCPQR